MKKLILVSFALLLIGFASANIVFDHEGNIEFRTDINFSEGVGIESVDSIGIQASDAKQRIIETNRSNNIEECVSMDLIAQCYTELGKAGIESGSMTYNDYAWLWYATLNSQEDFQQEGLDDGFSFEALPNERKLSRPARVGENGKVIAPKGITSAQAFLGKNMEVPGLNVQDNDVENINQLMYDKRAVELDEYESSTFLNRWSTDEAEAELQGLDSPLKKVYAALSRDYQAGKLNYSDVYMLRAAFEKLLDGKLDQLDSGEISVNSAMVDSEGNLVTNGNISSLSPGPISLEDGLIADGRAYIRGKTTVEGDLNSNQEVNVGESIESMEEISRVQPYNETHEAIYAAPTSPKEKIVITGDAKLSGPNEDITLPKHFRELAAGSVNVQLTPKTTDTTGLAVINSNKNFFRVAEIGSGTDNDVEFHYRVSAERKDTEDRNVTRIYDQNATGDDGPPALTSELNPPKDPDGDGLYENVRGGEGVSVLDVQALFNNLDNPKLQNNREYFSFAPSPTSFDDEISVLDVQSLFTEIDKFN
jgi:hypothetical protein